MTNTDATDELLKAHLDRMGVAIRIQHFTGDSSYPTEYTLIYGSVRAVGPTLDLALVEFLAKWIKTYGQLALEMRK